jgi:hypothetical protein
MLGHFENQTVAVVGGFQRGENGGQFAVERNVDDGADDLADLAGGGEHGGHRVIPFGRRQSASAPAMISTSSVVIAA